MTRLYNRVEMIDRRRSLRRDSTRAERVMWQNLRRNRVLGVMFKRQFSVGSFILDFYAPQLKLAIEVDGASHDTPEAQRYDKRRQQWIEQTGIEFLRFSDGQVLNDIERTMEAIAAHVGKLLSSDNQDPAGRDTKS